MSEAVLHHHLEDLLLIKETNLVDHAFCGAGFLSRWENAMTGGRTRLAEQLEDAIEICQLCQKRYANALSGSDVRKIQLLQATAAPLREDQIRKTYG
jgi:hypothetical protein